MKLVILTFVAALSFPLASFTRTGFSEASRQSFNSPAGRVYGPANVTRRVSAQATYTDQILFRGNQRAEVVIEGDGDCDLDLYVYNPEGVLITKDDDDTDYCYVAWTPDYTKSYRIVVKNRGNVYANYVLKTN